jgi:hypothetical protein
MTPFYLLFEKQVRHLIGGDFFCGSHWFPTLDERKFHSPPDCYARCVRLNQATAKNLNSHIPEFPPFIGGAQLHFANEFWGYVQCHFHDANSLTFELSVKSVPIRK